MVERCMMALSMIPRRKETDNGNECCVLTSCRGRSSAELTARTTQCSTNGFVLFHSLLFVHPFSAAEPEGP